MLSRSISILAAVDDDLLLHSDESSSRDVWTAGGGLLDVDATPGPDPLEIAEATPGPPELEPAVELVDALSAVPPMGDGPTPSSPAQAADPGPDHIDFNRLLLDRPDVLKGFYEAYYGPGNDRNSAAWAERVGGDTPEAYARYWYFAHGRWEGYAQGDTTAQDTVSAQRILLERPDVLRAFYEAYYGDGNDRNSTAWIKRVGGDTPEAYAKYWYDKYGRWEGYAQSDKASAEAIDIKRLLVERPDVFRAFFEEFYGENNDRKSHAWTDRVGGDTVEDYAKYWYVTYGQKEGYSQRPPNVDAPGDLGLPVEPQAPADPGPPVHDPADDPWNHPALFPDWQPPHEGWQRPPDIWHGSDNVAASPGPSEESDPAPTPSTPDPLPTPDPASGTASSLFEPDPFG